MTRDITVELTADVVRRWRVQPHEHPLLTRLVVLRVALNHEFGGAFEPYDRWMAAIEPVLQVALVQREEAMAQLVASEAQREALLKLAKEATNGWACYAKRKIEHDEIARLHGAIAGLGQVAASEAGSQEKP